MVARLDVFLGWLVKTGMFVATTEKVSIKGSCYRAYFHFYKNVNRRLILRNSNPCRKLNKINIKGLLYVVK